MVNWQIVYTQQALKDARHLKAAGLQKNAQDLLALLEEDPFKVPPRFEKLMGDLEGAYSRRLNIQHRLVYQVYLDQKIIKILRLWTHYE